MSQTATPSRRIAYVIEVDPEIFRMMPEILLEDGYLRRIEIKEGEAVPIPGKIIAFDMDTMDRIDLELIEGVSA